MNLVLLCLGVLGAILGWGCLAGAVLAFPDTDRPAIRAIPWPILCLDLLVSFGVFSMVFTIVRNWRCIPEMRRLVAVGATCLVGAAALLWLAFR